MKRRDFLAGAGATLLVPQAKAWFPHGAVATPPVTGTFSFVKTYDTSWATNPNRAQWDAVLAGVETFINTYFNIQCTVACQFGYGTVDGIPTSRLGQNQAVPTSNSTYAATKSTLLGLPTDPIKTSAYATLPGSDPSPFSVYRTTVGLNAIWTNTNWSSSAFAQNYAGWNSTANIFDLTPDGSSCAVGKYSLWGYMFHEIVEVLGKVSQLITSNTGPCDLFSYTSAGTRSFTISASRYFSYDGGTTNNGGSSAFFDTTNASTGNDPDDWGGTWVSPFNGATGFTGTVLLPTPGDVALLAAIGWPLTPAGRAYAGV